MGNDHVRCRSGPVGGVLIGAFLGAQLTPQLAPVDWGELFAVGLWIHANGSAARAAMERYALTEPFAEFLFGHTNKLLRAKDRSTEGASVPRTREAKIS
ncbi:UNVERIFIED_ORG: hypothetical protein GGE64_005090 [Rhizobium etli]